MVTFTPFFSVAISENKNIIDSTVFKPMIEDLLQHIQEDITSIKTIQRKMSD